MPSITFRPLQHQNDYTAMLTVRQQSLAHDNLDDRSPETRFPTLAALTQTYPLGADTQTLPTIRLALHQERVIGYQTIRWWQHQKGFSYMHHAYLLPKWRRQGIGTQMLGWAETTISTIAAQHDGPKQYRAYLATTEVEANHLLQKHGYIPSGGLIELTYNGRKPPHTPHSPPFCTQAPHPDDYHQIWLANEAVFADEPDRSPPTAASYQAFLADPAFDPSLWSIIWAEAEVAGVAFSEIAPHNIGVISQLSVGQQWRRRGLGQTLVNDAVRRLQARDVTQITVATDSDNYPALALYQRLAFTESNHFIHYRKPFS